ncbi:tail fiber domain-containing protein [Haliangium sp.]|uniref:tail fiber domain-containing protein n=1 Tax=Haliangium sp. TaxID=2663208 RepID=UPI003D12EA91
MCAADECPGHIHDWGDIEAGSGAHDLAVGGSVTASGYCIGNDCIEAWPAGDAVWEPRAGGIDYQGRVGIRTLDTNGALSVTGPDTLLVLLSEADEGIDRNAGMELRTVADSGVMYIDFSVGHVSLREPDYSGRISYNAVGTEAFAIEGGDLGIGMVNPQHPLHMASGAHVTAGGAWVNASSKASKQSISELDVTQAMQVVAELRPVTFEYKAERGEQYVGFIAEDVPALVASRDRSSLSSMDIVAVLTRVVQEQQRQLDELRARLDEMQP